MSALLSKVRLLPAAAGYAAWRLSGGRSHSPRKVAYITEPKDWVINKIGSHLAARIKNPPFSVAASPRFLRNTLVHFGAVHGFCHGGLERTHPSNRILLTIYHGNFGIDAEFDRTFKIVLSNRDSVTHFVASTSIMVERLAGWGIDRSKISRIPIGIDLGAIKGVRGIDKATVRASFGIPADTTCIGSFQKDGNGWGEGLEPKLVKGPDLFVDAVIELAKRRKVHCLLTGPARGYVKKRLGEAGIPFTHRYVDGFDGIAKAYRCLDLYLVSSREEGGPMALMESMASGVPLVSTRVGMAPDIIDHGRNGYLVEVGDVDGMVRSMKAILDSEGIRKTLIENGLTAAERFGYDRIAEEYRDLYRQLLKN
jgi:glycosyltransferase involved in cell wall biosynthesis